MIFRNKISLSLLLFIALCVPLSAQQVEISDPNLRAGIADALDIPRGSPITQEDMNRLTHLNVRGQGIVNLTGLEFATNLTFLQLQANQIEDINPLANLTQLTDLRLGGNPIRGISPLAHLTQLTLLRLNECGTIDDISALAHLTQLNWLDLDRNLIVDISPLAGLTALTSLDLRGNRIIDVSPLANLTQLAELRLSENQIIDITPLANLTNLVALWLSDNQITDVIALANLTQLTELRLDNNQIKDINPLENLTNLEHLDTNNNPIFDPNSPLVEVPDPNLRTAIREALNLPDGVPPTQASMRHLTTLNARERQIESLAGLEYATNLTFLYLPKNRIEDISPLANLMQLTELDLSKNRIVDVSPLASLTELTELHLRENRIVGVSPLANLTNLVGLLLNRNRIINVTALSNLTQLGELRLNENRIVDVSPLARLTKLELLDLRRNPITDYTALDGLALTHFLFDQICELPPLSIHDRIKDRNFPSIFTPWAGPHWVSVVNRPDLSGVENVALHDLWLSGPQFGLDFTEMPDGFTMAGNLEEAIQRRDEFLALNPNMIFLVDIRMREDWSDTLPEDWPYWVRDANGDVVSDWPGANLLDFTHPYIQDRIVQQAIAVAKCGLFDGIFFDYWSEGQVLAGLRTREAELRARDNIIQRIRAATRNDFLIAGNTNDRTIPRTGPYINGGVMETGVPGLLTAEQLEIALGEIESSLLWLEQNLREPRINVLQGAGYSPELSPANLRQMRAITTLSLTHSDGYVLYSITGGFNHYWYDFWDADLGRPVGPKAQLYDEDIPGLYIREYTNGWAAYNHSGKQQVVNLPEKIQGVSSTHVLPNLDGEMYLRVKPKNPADVHGDGVVNILDLVAVAQAFGKDGLQGDVNGDGVVNVFDLVFVAGAIGGGGAAPSAYSPELSIISAADVSRWLALAGGLGVGDANFQRGIRFLEGLLAALTPEETMLLPNYPNPFNPETWIPYRLAQEAEVVITIYDTKGTLVRRLALGNQAAGYYAKRGKAAYWDGRNEDGEAVASGIYIYQFRAGDYAASRRMVIVK